MKFTFLYLDFGRLPHSLKLYLASPDCKSGIQDVLL